MPLAGRLSEVACATIQAEGDGGGCRWKSCINDGTSPTTSSVPLAFRRPLPGVHHAYPSFSSWASCRCPYRLRHNCPCRRDGRVDPRRRRARIGLVLPRVVAGPRPRRHPKRADPRRRRKRQAGHRHRRRCRPARLPRHRHHLFPQRNRIARRPIPTRRHGSARRVGERLGRQRAGCRPRGEIALGADGGRFQQGPQRPGRDG